MAGLLAIVKENWPNFLHGKDAEEIKVTRRNWLAKLGGYPVPKLEKAAAEIHKRFPGEWAPNISLITQYLDELMVARPEHQMFKYQALPDRSEATLAKGNENLDKMRKRLGMRPAKR